MIQKTSLLVIACLVGIVSIGCGSPKETDWVEVAPNIVAPDFSLELLDGGSVQLSSLRGSVVIVEFWASWCGPCRFSTPSVDKMYRAYKDEGLEVLLVNQGESEEVIREWMQDRFTAAVLLDRSQEVAQLYGASGIPHLVVIDQSGNIRYIESGYRGGLERNLSFIIERLLSEQSGRANA